MSEETVQGNSEDKAFNIHSKMSYVTILVLNLQNRLINSMDNSVRRDHFLTTEKHTENIVRMI